VSRNFQLVAVLVMSTATCLAAPEPESGRLALPDALDLAARTRYDSLGFDLFVGRLEVARGLSAIEAVAVASGRSPVKR
jgi:hypothetical protein